MKRLMAMLLAFMLCMAAQAGAQQDAERVIPYLSDTEIGGAAAYAGRGDAQSGYYPQIDWFEAESRDSLTVLTGVRTYQQTTDYTCGPAAALIAYDRLGGDTSSMDDVTLAWLRGAQSLQQRTTVAMMESIFDSLGWEYVSSHTLRPAQADMLCVTDLYAYIDAGLPVMVGWLEWGGHWTVLIGYDDMATADADDDVLVMADPYDTFDHCQDGYTLAPAAQFERLWRFDSTQEGVDDAEKPFIVACPPDMAALLR